MTKTADQHETEQTLTAQIVYALHQQLIELFLRGFPGVEATVNRSGIWQGGLPARIATSLGEGVQCIKKSICVC